MLCFEGNQLKAFTTTVSPPDRIENSKFFGTRAQKKEAAHS